MDELAISSLYIPIYIYIKKKSSSSSLSSSSSSSLVYNKYMILMEIYYGEKGR